MGGVTLETVKLSVRKLVEFVLRSGDIDSRYADPGAMADGAKIHRKIQKLMGDRLGGAYKSEVPLKLRAEAGGVSILLQGRADGIITGEDGSLTIDEIKSTTLPFALFYRQRDLHLGQAKCYAHMFLAGIPEPPEEIGVQLTYYQMESGEIEYFNYMFSRQELYDYFIEYADGKFNKTAHGVFGASMKVELINDGPFTVILED